MNPATAISFLDVDAAGRGWFIDATPNEDSEFANALSETHLAAEDGQIPVGQIDLLTSVLHEFGHELGFDHFAGENNLLSEELATGERLLPEDTFMDDNALVGLAPDLPGDRSTVNDPQIGLAPDLPGDGIVGRNALVGLAPPELPNGPIANNDGQGGEFKIAPGGSIDILVSELLANDVDPDGEQFNLTDIFEGIGGSANLEQVGAETVVRFTASETAQNGEAGGFQYQVTNESGGVGFAMIDDMNAVS